MLGFLSHMLKGALLHFLLVWFLITQVSVANQDLNFVILLGGCLSYGGLWTMLFLDYGNILSVRKFIAVIRGGYNND